MLILTLYGTEYNSALALLWRHIRAIGFFKTNKEEDTVNLPLLEKIKIIDTLDIDEKDALLKLIDMAVSKKKLKNNLTNLIAS
jgi:hypothetical protein